MQPGVARPRQQSASDDLVVETVDLTRTYRQGHLVVPALRGVSLAVERGELVAIMGPSGSGKSTLLHLLGGLDVADSGRLVVAGRELGAMTDDQRTLFRRRTIGFVFQTGNLVPTLTVEENVALPLLLDGTTLRGARPRVRAALESVALLARASHMPDQLSGGESQRVAVARALVAEPAVVLADEPTGSLDSRTATGVLELLRRAANERGQTVIMVTHDARAAGYASRIVRVVDGAVVRTLEEVPCVRGER